ncbi:MAG: pyruvate dehydrogenase E1 component alpha subunit [Myxococcota bacterium]|jgi:pyruvate dehydrogenase E1 component alpha subunit
MDDDGSLLRGEVPDGLEKADLLTMFETMLMVRTIDERMVTLQRQGRISFYGAATGQEAAVIGSGYALSPDDWVLPALREGGVALLRGFSLEDYVNQVFGNGEDIQRGRQMPCHYGDKRIGYVTLSSCIANQLPHAVGVALAMRARGEQHIAVGYMGDGATSEGDFHTSLEFASRLNAPVLFFCQNNQWAISTGIEGQTIAKSLACKAHGYGMDGYRVDGNDVLAVQEVTRLAATAARETGRPVFVEALTYRVGAHSTSDDPSRYRDESVTETWRTRDPIVRFGNLLKKLGYLSDESIEAQRLEFDARIRAQIIRAEKAPAPTIDDLFTDVYAEMPALLVEQRDALERHLSEN